MDDILKLLGPQLTRIESDVDKNIQKLSAEFERKGMRKSTAFLDAARGQFIIEMDRTADLLIQHRVPADKGIPILDASKARALDFMSREHQRWPDGSTGTGAINDKGRWERELTTAIDSQKSRVRLAEMNTQDTRTTAKQTINIIQSTIQDSQIGQNQNVGGPTVTSQQHVSATAPVFGTLMSRVIGPLLALWKWLAGGWLANERST